MPRVTSASPNPPERHRPAPRAAVNNPYSARERGGLARALLFFCPWRAAPSLYPGPAVRDGLPVKPSRNVTVAGLSRHGKRNRRFVVVVVRKWETRSLFQAVRGSRILA